MDQQAELWGTVSVRDHLRPHAFAAELVLFETLVIPRPPSGAVWPAEWNAARQDEILGWIPDDHLMEVPWIGKHSKEWKKRMISADAEEDVAEIQKIPELKSAQEKNDFDAPAFHNTRRVLQDFVDRERQDQILQGVPGVKVAVIPAYDGPKAFLDDAPAREKLLRAFGWEFLVPHHESSDGKRRSHRDQIKAAIDLATLPEAAAHRAAFRAWTSLEALKGTSQEKAREKMEVMIKAYAEAVAATNIPVRLEWGVGIAEFAAAVAAMAIHPAFALCGPVLKLGGLAARPQVEAAAEVPVKVKPAALIHAMREQFSKTGVEGLSFDAPPGIRIEDHWPNGSPALYL